MFVADVGDDTVGVCAVVEVDVDVVVGDVVVVVDFAIVGDSIIIDDVVAVVVHRVCCC